MLSKLLKYEFKSTSRLLLVLYAAILVLGLILGFAGKNLIFDYMLNYMPYENIPNGQYITLMILGIVYMALIMILMIITFVIVLERFYKNLLGGEGYLMHTLPVPTWMLILSKLICAFVWEIMAIVVCILSVILMISSAGIWSYILKEYDFLIQAISEHINLNFALGIVGAIIGSLSGILMFYFAMAVGGSAKKHKLFFSVLTFIAVLIILSIIESVTNFSFIREVAYDSTVLSSAFTTAYIKDIVSNIIYGVIFFLGTNFFLKHRLNLE